MTRRHGSRGAAAGRRLEPCSSGAPATWVNLALALASVVSFFGIVEAALWAAGTQTLLAERDPFQGFSRLVRVFEEYPERGIHATPPRAVQHTFNYQEFRSLKPAGGFRFFVLGGSSAAGFPWGADAAFARVLGDALSASWPGRSIEAVNAAGMSYGSHRLRILAHEILDYSPDALIVYEAHNEFVEERFYRAVLKPDDSLGRFHALLYRSRLYSLMIRMAERVRGVGREERSSEGRAVGELLGLDVVREDAAGTREEEKSRVRGRFEENLRGILDLAVRRNVPVVLCTVASNVRDWPPNQSLFGVSLSPEARDAALALLERAKGLHEGGDAAAAAATLEEALRLAPGYAEILFRLGRAYETLSRWKEAHDAYALARDLDAQPSRALGSFNETIRRVAAERGAILVDIERVFEEASPHGLVGFNLIEDYVHPNPKGHRLIALELWKAFNGSGLLGEVRGADASEFWKAVGAAPEGNAASAVGLALRPGETAPRAAIWLYNQAGVLEQQGFIDQAIEKYRACLEREPGYYAAAFNLGRLLHLQRRFDLAVKEFSRALAVKPDHVKSMIGLGMALLELGRADQAAEAFVRATETDPLSASAWNGLGYSRETKGDPASATSAYRKAVALEPENAQALCNLALALFRQGHVDESIRYFRASLAVRHDLRRARQGLADALISTGEVGEAEQIYRALLRMDPNDSRAAAGLAAVQARRSARP